MRMPLLLTLALTLCATGCPPAEAPSAPQAAEAPAGHDHDDHDDHAGHDHPAGETAHAPAEAPVPAGPQAVTGTHEVICGCALESVGHCGEYAKVDGQFVELTGELGLGDMPFCGKTGLQAEIEGQLQDGKLAATSLKLVP